MPESAELIKKEIDQILDNWIDSCTRSGKVSRNTIAVGVVVLDHLRKKCPIVAGDVISGGGEIKGARSGLGNILEIYGIPKNYLKEITTRQAHQDAQRLFERLDWGKKLLSLGDEAREILLRGLINSLLGYAREWLLRQNLKLNIDRREGPNTWVHLIVESARQRSGGVVEQHLIGAKLERRFTNIKIPNHPAHAGDQRPLDWGTSTFRGIPIM